MKNLLFISLLFFFFASCKKEESYSNEPQISFKDFSITYEETSLGQQLVGTLSFSFVDGDGDIGYYENSDTSIHLPIIHDVFILEYNKINGSYTFEDTLKYWLPYFQEGIYKKTLKGTIDIKLYRTINNADTVYFDFFITDRSNNTSNIETSPEIIFSELAKQ